MCTVGVLFRTHPSAPLIVAQNRDERMERASDPVTLWTPPGRDVPVVAGRDRVSGGTWFAVGPRLVAAVTNQRTADRSPPGQRSRGELVTTSATSTTLAEAEAWLRDLDGGEFGPFHLLVSDGERLRWVTNMDGPIAVHDVPPGVHVLRNTALDDDDDPVDAFVRRELSRANNHPLDDCVRELQRMLAVPYPEGPNIDLGFYGTKSSGVLAWGANPERDHVRYLTSPAAPAPGRWSDVSALVDEVRAFPFAPRG